MNSIPDQYANLWKLYFFHLRTSGSVNIEGFIWRWCGTILVTRCFSWCDNQFFGLCIIKADCQVFFLIFRECGNPINVLTGLDYWLDNLMCNVPEVAMCYHLDGIVQVSYVWRTVLYNGPYLVMACWWRWRNDRVVLIVRASYFWNLSSAPWGWPLWRTGFYQRRVTSRKIRGFRGSERSGKGLARAITLAQHSGVKCLCMCEHWNDWISKSSASRWCKLSYLFW